MALYKIFIIITFFAGIISLNSCKNDTIIQPGPIGDQPVYPLIDAFPVWSPDGTKIIYNHYGITRIDAGGSYQVNRDSAGLWMINIDGKNSHLILKGNDINADWSSDGKWIVYEVGAQIYKAPVINDVVDILKIKQLTFEGRNFFPAWSPDGKWIAYDSNKDSPNGMNFIWKMRSDGSGKIRLAYEPKKSEIREPNWSPDGNSIVHIRYSADFNTDASEICIMDQNGNKLKRLTFNDVMENNPKYSADGTKIVFWLSGVLWIMDSDGNNLKKIYK